MNYLLDLIVIAIIAAVALISARRGFVRVVIELAGLCHVYRVTHPFVGKYLCDKIMSRPACFSVSKATGTNVTDYGMMHGTLCRNL